MVLLKATAISVATHQITRTAYTHPQPILGSLSLPWPGSSSQAPDGQQILCPSPTIRGSIQTDAEILSYRNCHIIRQSQGWRGNLRGQPRSSPNKGPWLSHGLSGTPEIALSSRVMLTRIQPVADFASSYRAAPGQKGLRPMTVPTNPAHAIT